MNKYLDEIESFQYTIKCNGTGTITNRISGINSSNSVYQVQWENIIPDKYRNNKFLVTFKLQCALQGAVYFPVVMVYCNFGNQYVFNNSNNMSRCIGLALPVGVNASTTGQNCYYNCIATDNPPFMIDYPTNNQLGVTFKDIISSNYPTFYYITFNFQVIK